MDRREDELSAPGPVVAAGPGPSRAPDVTCHALAPGGALVAEPEATAVARWRGGAGPYWIHLGGGAPDAVKAWLSGLGIDDELLELMQLEQDETRLLPFAGSVYVSYPLPAEREDGKPAHFAFLALERLLVTIDPRPGGPAGLADVPIARLKLREGTAAGVVCALALVQAGRLRRHVVTLRREGDGLADRMDSDPWSVSLEEILAAKRRVFALGSVVDEELAVLGLLKASDLPVLSLRAVADAFQAAIEISRATERDMDRLDRRMSDLHERYEGALAERTSRRLGVLTVLSAIFMPLTLIAGIYGMNFEFMPELHSRWGYPLVLGGMAAIAAGLGWWFKTRWWSR